MSINAIPGTDRQQQHSSAARPQQLSHARRCIELLLLLLHQKQLQGCTAAASIHHSSMLSTPLAAWPLQSLPLVLLLQDFGEHGREFITCEVGMELVKLLAEPARLAQALSSVSNSSAARTIDSLINHVVFKVRAWSG